MRRSFRDRTTRKVLRRGLVGLTAQDETRRVWSKRTTTPPAGGLAILGNLSPGTILCDEYVVRSTIHPHETSAPGLFRCLTREGADVLLKVAPTQHPPKPDLWSLLPHLDHPNVVRTLKTLSHDGLFYEVQEFCSGGSLADCLGDSRIDPDWICDYLVPQVNEGLKYLHAKAIVHRDIKPSNLYLRENDLFGPLVLGDFDISSVLVSDRTSRQTTRMAGTWAYCAPEGFPRFTGDDGNSVSARITRTADYYSMGITIIELLTGTTSLHSCGLPDLYDFYLTGGKVELPDVPARLLLLLKGLLVRNRHERWCGPQVDRWLEGASTRDDMQAIINDQRFNLAKATKPYSLGSAQAVDLPSLALMMEKNPTEAKSHLLESDLLTQWIENQDNAVAHQVERTRERYRNSPDLALFRCIMLCDPSRPLEVPEYGSVNSISEWTPLLVGRAATERHLHAGPVSDFELRRLEAWLELKTKPEKALATQIGEIRQRPIAVRFEEIAFLLDRRLPYSGQISAFLNLRRPASERIGAGTPEEIAKEAFGVAADWDEGVPTRYRTARDRWQQGYLEAWLRQRGLAELHAKASAAAALFQANVDEAFDVFLRNLDPWSEKPQLVFDDSAAAELRIPYGSHYVYPVTYRTLGPGFPMGSIKLEGARTHVGLDSYKVVGRSGKFQVSLHPRGRLMEGVREDAFRIVADRGNFWVQNDGLELRYQVTFAFKDALLRGAVGAGIGSFILGLARAITQLFLPHAVTPVDMFAPAATARIDPTAYVGGAVLCAGAVYLAFTIWLRAYKGSGL